MGLRDLLKKKDQLDGGASAADAASTAETLDRLQAGPEFTFIRSDTHTQEIIHPPQHRGDHRHHQQQQQYLQSGSGGSGNSKARRSLDVFRPSSSSKSSRPSSSSSTGGGKGDYLNAAPKGGMHRRLSQRLHLSRDKHAAGSDYVPGDLPQISVTAGDDGGDKDRSEREWEKRATMLALAADAEERRKLGRSPSVAGVGQTSPVPEITGLDLGGRFGDAAVEFGSGGGGGGGALPSPSSPRRPSSNHTGVVSSKTIDDNIQEAIRLHEEGELEQSTLLFGRLADPQGANNPLSQVLYGLALRHGWGCQPDPGRAVSYLSAAASNAAEVERMALQAGLNKGGAAKGELILAIFELANCFRNGWGVDRDPVAAKQYYETAANLGDTDAMNEVGWCYIEGFGCKKDKYASARYYRLAEENGNKTLGNTWIWKDKYNPGGKKK